MFFSSNPSSFLRRDGKKTMRRMSSFHGVFDEVTRRPAGRLYLAMLLMMATMSEMSVYVVDFSGHYLITIFFRIIICPFLGSATIRRPERSKKHEFEYFLFVIEAAGELLRP